MAKMKKTKKTETSKKPPTKPTKSAPAFDLEAHNRHLKIMGLPAVKKPLVEGPPASPKPVAKKGSPLALLDSFYAGEGPTAPRGRYIHWWGQFSGELPAPFTLKQGGHGYLEARDVEHATKLFAKLRNAVLKMKPKLKPDPDDEDAVADAEAMKQYGLKGTREWAGIDARGKAWYRWMRLDGTQMTVELLLNVTKKDLRGARLLKPK